LERRGSLELLLGGREKKEGFFYGFRGSFTLGGGGRGNCTEGGGGEKQGRSDLYLIRGKIEDWISNNRGTGTINSINAEGEKKRVGGGKEVSTRSI